MNTPPILTPPLCRRFRLWRWVLGFCAGVFLGVAGMAYSVLTLSREAATLRREMMAAVEVPCATRMQLSLGAVPLTLLRTGLHCVALPPEARAGLRAVRNASVGVYELQDELPAARDSRWLAKADQAMARRGYERMAAINEGARSVLIYTPKTGDGDDLDVCLAVLDHRQLVVVSARVASEPLTALIATHRPNAQAPARF